MDLRQKVSKLVGIKGKTSRIEYRDVEAAFLKNHPSGDKNYLAQAYDFASRCHEGQMRRSGEPYIVHPLAVAHFLAESKLDIETIAAALLHDVVEDCGVQLSELESKFGKSLCHIVDGVTKIGKVQLLDKTDAQAENYRKMILAMSEDVRVLIVKLADRYHNMQTLVYLKKEKRRRISQETLDIYAPLAQRLGMSFLRNELERLAFFHLEPIAYKSLEKELSERQRKNRDFLDQITRGLNELLEKHRVEADITSRIKGHYSIFKKLDAKQTTLEGLYDYYAFRLISGTVEDCYKIFGLLHSKWHHIPGRIKDFIATPKPNLYQSIHTTLISGQGQPFEVQVRTKMMHRIAEEGVAAHWTYKNGKLLQVGKNEFVAWLKKVADEQKEVDDNEEFLEVIKGQLQTKDILVFTPNSEIKTLPKGSTPLDFAYMIHTEVGHQAKGAKVDGKMVPLRSELQSGNIVEILTSPQQKPHEEWLKIVKTASARAKIRSWLRAEEKIKAVDMGKTLFEHELKRFKIPLKRIKKEAILQQLPGFDKKKIEDFYSAIGFGSITPRNAVKPFLPPDTQENPEENQRRENRLKKAIQKFAGKSKHMVLVKGQNDILVHLSNCCNPIIGDDIVGYITKGRGISVHKKDCRSFNQQKLNPERKMAVAWDGGAERQIFSVYLRVYTEDRAGILADISGAIANNKTNVLNLKATVNQDKSMGIFDMVLQIYSLDHLNKVIRDIGKIKGFLSHKRMH